jgi:protocatechuate 3,4-dioxygenase beta subunit
VTTPPRQDTSRFTLPHYRTAPDLDPPLDHPPYYSTELRHPTQPLTPIPQTLTEITGPIYGESRVTAADADLTHVGGGEAIGQRIVVHGRVVDADRRPVPDTLVEVWQANAAGRYRHRADRYQAPLDPNFTGGGRVVTDALGRYRFLTIKPGAYPWFNHPTAFRPAHIHFSLFGRAFTQRLVTQMYFPGDPLFFQDPIFNAVPDPKARDRLISVFDYAESEDQHALAFRFDIVLRGRDATWFESVDAG